MLALLRYTSVSTMCKDGTRVDLRRYLLWRDSCQARDPCLRGVQPRNRATLAKCPDLLWQLKSFPNPNKESYCGNIYSGDRLQKMSIKQTVYSIPFLNMWFMMLDKGNDIKGCNYLLFSLSVNLLVYKMFRQIVKNAHHSIP